MPRGIHADGSEATLLDYNMVQRELMEELRELIEKHSGSTEEARDAPHAFAAIFAAQMSELAAKYQVPLEHIAEGLRSIEPKLALQLEACKWLANEKGNPDAKTLRDVSKAFSAEVCDAVCAGSKERIVTLICEAPVVLPSGELTRDENHSSRQVVAFRPFGEGIAT